MDIATKYKLLEKIIQIDDDILLCEVKSLLDSAETDFWDELPADVKQSIDIAQEELARGEGIPHQEVMAEIRARFLNK